MTAYDLEITEDLASELLGMAEGLGFDQDGPSPEGSIVSLLQALSQIEPDALEAILKSYELLP